MAIREIHVTGYRSVRSLRLHLSQINVLTGANATGKTNLYNSVFLLAKAAAGGFAQVIAEEGGMPSVLWAGARKSRSMGTIRMEGVRMSLGIKTDTFSYELICGLPKQSSGEKSAFSLDPEVKEERVWMDAPHGLKVTFFERSPKGAWILDNEERLADYSGELLPTESVLSQLREPHLYPELSSLRAEMSRWRFYHHFRTDAESPLRHPQVGVRTPVLAHDGRDLAAALQTINESVSHRICMRPSGRRFPARRLRSSTMKTTECLPCCCACRDCGVLCARANFPTARCVIYVCWRRC